MLFSTKNTLFLALAASSAMTTNAGCSYSTTFHDPGNSNFHASRTVSGFDVGSGGAVTCRISGGSCGSGMSSLGVNEPGYGGGSGSNTNYGGCSGLSSTEIFSSCQSSMGFSVFLSNPNNVQMTCSCTSGGGGCGGGSSGGSGGGGIFGGGNGGNSGGGGGIRGPGGDPGCFSADTTVQVQNKGTIPMKDLQVGDSILTAGHKYQPVYSFGHLEETKEATFYQLYTSSNKKSPLEMTGNHLVYVDGKTVRADAVKVGDYIQQNEENVPVTKITQTEKKGLYMPLTESGTLLVNGILASTYVSFQEEAGMIVDNIKIVPFITEEVMIHMWLAPQRLLCLGVSSNFCKAEGRNEEGISNWLAAAKAVVEYAEEQPYLVRAGALGIPALLFFGTFNGIEAFFGGASMAPLAVMAALVMAWMVANNKRAQEGKKKTL